ncbi:MAG TPA: LuxR C-terminal-related transcriptional regulator [Ktedonobacterales bacterium]|nr:LuxR C-terminal-related transcriptional regulator [Ktedonobacterales bacterium]
MGTPLVTVQHGRVNAPIEVGSAEWFVWLDRVDAFVVEEQDISYIAQRVHDGASALWLAFCAIENEPRWVVLGSAPELTRERLRTAAYQLASGDTVIPAFQVELDGESGPVTRLPDLPDLPHLPVTSPDLLVTKLEMPNVDRGMFVRTRAIERMGHVLAYPLTIINAPSGYGKTTLVAAWAGETSARVAWLLLDENDNDPTRFSTHLLAALDRVVPGLLAVGLRHVKNARAHVIDVSLISRLINVLTSTEDHIVLVLDDYHTISPDNAVIHTALKYFVDHLPTQIHVVLLTRTCVPLSTARMRVAGRLLELRIEDMRFTGDEARTFLERKTGKEIAPEACARIHRRTEGWVAGLQLAAFALEDPHTPAESVADLLSENRNVVDFIADEVLKRLPQTVGENVLWMAALDQFSVALCDALPEIVDCQTTLEILERENAFLVPVDDSPGWYRFHRLFREVLWNRLQRTHKDDLAELYRQASAWYDAHGMTRDAVHYALRANDEHAVVRIVRDLANRVFESGSSPTELHALAQCLDLVPVDVIQRHPQLSLIQAQMFIESGDLSEGEEWLEAADLLISSQGMTAESEAAASDDHLRMKKEIMQIRDIIARLREGSPSAGRGPSPLTHASHASHAGQRRATASARPSAKPSARPLPMPTRLQRPSLQSEAHAHHSSTAPEPPVIYERVTAREKEVLALLARGDRNHGIAEELTIALATVKRHLSNLYRKLQVDNRTQAVWRAWTLGLLEDLPEESANTLAPDDDQPQPNDRGMSRWDRFPSAAHNGHAPGNGYPYPPGVSPG